MIAVMIGTIAAFQAVEREKNFTDLATLDHMLSDAQTLAPDLRSWVGNAQSLHKMQVAFVSATLPEFESTEPTPYHRYKSIFTITLSNGSKSTQNELDFLDWNGRKVFAYDSGSGRWFTTFAQAWLYTTARTEEFTPTLQYFAWGRGLALPQRYTASRLGADRFIVTKGDPVVGDAACPADPISGVSNMGDVSKCLSYITREIRYYSSTGTEATLTLSIAPVFTTSFYQASFVIGAAKTFQITADGAPPPMITMSSGSTLPQGITFQGSDVAGPGKANLVFNGYAAAGGGANVLFEAKNSAGTAYKGIDVFVGYDVKITSGGTINATVGVPMSFDVAATGDWVSLTLDSGTLPPGLTFTNKGYSAGVATIAGTVLPRLQVAGTYTFGVKAKNNVAQDVKIFNLVVGWP